MMRNKTKKKREYTGEIVLVNELIETAIVDMKMQSWCKSDQSLILWRISTMRLLKLDTMPLRVITQKSHDSPCWTSGVDGRMEWSRKIQTPHSVVEM